jgi:hypothetical protein
MKAINIQLTKWQTEMLKPLFNDVRSGFESKNPRAIFAQIWESLKEDDLAFMAVKIIDSEKCEAIQAINGVVEGKLSDGKTREATILVPEED